VGSQLESGSHHLAEKSDPPTFAELVPVMAQDGASPELSLYGLQALGSLAKNRCSLPKTCNKGGAICIK